MKSNFLNILSQSQTLYIKLRGEIKTLEYTIINFNIYLIVTMPQELDVDHRWWTTMPNLPLWSK